MLQLFLVIENGSRLIFPVMRCLLDREFYTLESTWTRLPMPKEKVKRPRKTKELPPPVCEVQPISDEDMYVED
jgi:hypothetical protein